MGSAISSLIVAAERGDRPSAEALFAALYSELHRLAKRELARSGLPVTLSATTLLHEAYLDMAARDGPSFPDRARFMGYAARVMRGLIIDHVRVAHAQGDPTSSNLGQFAEAEASLKKAQGFVDSVLAVDPGNRRALFIAATIAHDRMELAEVLNRRDEMVSWAGETSGRVERFMSLGKVEPKDVYSMGYFEQSGGHTLANDVGDTDPKPVIAKPEHVVVISAHSAGGLPCSCD
ncbi:MAG: ECF-type sigma factor, partial [Terracidiphilus sp.]